MVLMMRCPRRSHSKLLVVSSFYEWFCHMQRQFEDKIAAPKAATGSFSLWLFTLLFLWTIILFSAWTQNVPIMIGMGLWTELLSSHQVPHQWSPGKFSISQNQAPQNLEKVSFFSIEKWMYLNVLGYKVHFHTPNNGKRQSVHPCCVWHSGATWMALRFLAWRRARKWHGTFASLRHVKDRSGFKCHDVSWWIGRIFAGVTKTMVDLIQKWTVKFGWFGVPPWVGNFHIYAMGRTWADGMMAVTI